MSDVAAIVIGVVVLAGAPLLYRRRNDAVTQRTAGLARASTGFSSGRPRTPRQLRVDAIVAVVLGAALIIYGIAGL